MLSRLAQTRATVVRPLTRGILQSILHGSAEAKEAGEVEVQQHSRLVARGKYVHAFEIHRVKPEARAEYIKAAEKYYSGLKDDEKLHVKLSGNWETIVGDLDSYVHILEYENYSGYDKSTALIRNSSHSEAYEKILPFLTSRTSQLCQEFAFLPTSPPRTEGGIFELRTYQLLPGKLLEWESTWRQGIEARRKFVEPVGAWFSQVGRLHLVHHLWQYPDMNTRKELREEAWRVDRWSDTVHKTSQLAKYMDSQILLPTSFSTLK